MNVRPVRRGDRRILKEIHQRRGYDYPFPKSLRGYQVVCDDAGRPIGAAGYKLVPEVTMILEPGASVHPLVKFKGIALLHDALRGKLTGKHTEAFAFLPPEIERSYGRHLGKHFGWRRAWTAYAIREGGGA